MKLKNLAVLVLPWFLSATLVSPAHAQGGDSKPITSLPVQYAATAIGQAGMMAGRTFGVNVYINAWTSDQQVKDYVATLKKTAPTVS